MHRRRTLSLVLVSVVATGLFQDAAAQSGVLTRVSPDPETFVENTDFTVLFNSAQYVFTGFLQAVGSDATSSLGCAVSDFFGFTAGFIALINRGTCTFAQKFNLALAAGARAAVIVDLSPGLVTGTLGPDPIDLAGVIVTQELGAEFRSQLAQGSVVLTVGSVPEPGTITLLATGILGIAAAYSRRRRRVFESAIRED